MIHELRIYEIFEHNKDAFHKRFQEHAMRIMDSYGFKIVATWETKSNDRTEFVYLLEWPNERAMHSAWEKFRSDKEWKEVKRATNAKHGDLVGEIQDRPLISTDYGSKLKPVHRKN